MLRWGFNFCYIQKKGKNMFMVVCYVCDNDAPGWLYSEDEDTEDQPKSSRIEILAG